jgi:hypothetical protein
MKVGHTTREAERRAGRPKAPDLETSSFAKVEKNSESSEESRDAMRMFCSDPPHDRDDGV